MENNVLIFSDIHINDYSNYNRSKESRLFQSRKLSQLLIKAGIENNCDRFIIAGDLSDVPVIKGTILNEIKLFLDVLCRYYKKDNYIIYGQHDLSTKDNDQEPRFSPLTAILPPNLFYSDKCQFILCGKVVAMMNWRPIQDLSWINGVVDLFVGHVTMAPPNAPFKGQDIDKSKFKLSITGDIHKHFVNGKMVSIGSCQQNKLGDQEESTAIIWNPNDNTWKVIDLDPNKELLRLRYVSDRNLEGFDKIDNYYNVYKPLKLSKNNSDVIDIPKWAEISDLTDKIISENGLSLVHEEVLKYCKFEDDVDFNFIPIKLRLKNFRSIESIEINFDDFDKISISGNNGSGKSSLILGLYNALRENRSLKDFVRFGSNDCECEIEFFYQGSNNKILRGTKSWGCWVNGEKLSYNNKREFEEDMLRRYSFLNYIDIFFFNADRSTIIGSMNPERKSEIISKLFKINKIDGYNSTSISMRDDLIRTISGKLDEGRSIKSNIELVSDQLKSVSLPESDLNYLLSYHESLLSQQKEYYSYIEFKNETERMKGIIDSNTDQLNSLTSKLDSIDINGLGIRKNELNSLISEVRDSKSKVSDLINLKSMNKMKLDGVNRDGNRVYNDLMKVKSNTCPTCGSKVILSDLEDSLSNEMNHLIESRNKILSDLEFIDKSLSSMKPIDELDKDLNDLTSELYEIDKRIFEYNSITSQISSINDSISRYSKDMKDKFTEKSFSVTSLPDNFLEILNKTTLDISQWRLYNDLNSRKSELSKRLDEIEKDIKGFESNIQLLDKYIKLTSPTGDIYREVMVRISKDFSDDVIRYEVNQYKFRNKDHLDLEVQYNVAGRWVSYQSLSSGQKTMADINFLSRILVECGLLVFDETLKHLSPSSTEYCLDIMSRMNVHAMILTSHAYGTESFSNKVINLNLDESGLTKIN